MGPAGERNMPAAWPSITVSLFSFQAIQKLSDPPETLNVIQDRNPGLIPGIDNQIDFFPE
jgi:hypothetical protein